MGWTITHHAECCAPEGDNAREKIIKRAEEHSQDLKEWVEFNCTFPNCMVDRITPITPTEVSALVSGCQCHFVLTINGGPRS
jgi:mannitol-1-phosphate/altronate dehydrogenase